MRVLYLRFVAWALRRLAPPPHDDYRNAWAAQLEAERRLNQALREQDKERSARPSRWFIPVLAVLVFNIAASAAGLAVVFLAEEGSPSTGDGRPHVTTLEIIEIVGCVPRGEETCDGLDNDCDGIVDEGCTCVDGATQPCGTDMGACTRGIQTCSAGRWRGCLGAIGPASEVCDGLDNDCDGDIDEGSFCACRAGETRLCGTDLGACTAGTQRCTAGSWSACSGIGPAPETSNGIDDDCDGAIDEDSVCR